MTLDKREKAKGLAQAFRKMEKPANKGGTGGTFTAAATKAGYSNTPEARKEFARSVIAHKDEHSPKMIKKALFYNNVINKH